MPALFYKGANYTTVGCVPHVPHRSARHPVGSPVHSCKGSPCIGVSLLRHTLRAACGVLNTVDVLHHFAMVEYSACLVPTALVSHLLGIRSFHKNFVLKYRPLAEL